MKQEAVVTTSELETFEERNTPEGLFLRYARARIRGFRSRQVLTIGGSLALVFLVSPEFGALVALLVFVGEGVDCFALYRLSKGGIPPGKLGQVQRLSTFTALVQSLSLGLVVLLTWYAIPDGTTHYYSMIFLTGAAINAGLVWPYNRTSSIARLSVFVAIGFWLNVSDMLWSEVSSVRVGFDTLATVMLAYMTAMFLFYANNAFYRRQAKDRSLFEQKQELAEIHEQLVAKELQSRNLALVAQSANDIVIITGADRKIEWANPAFTKVTGFTLQDALGMEVGELLNGPQTDCGTVEKIGIALSLNQPIRTEIRNHTKTGGTVWVEANITPIVSKDGALTKVISVERDITRAKEREAELAQAMIAAEEGAKTKENFLATMSHEIRTPLNGIIGMADLLKQSRLAPEQEKYADTILHSGEALLRIINDILDISKARASGTNILAEPFSLSQCLRESVTLLEPLSEEKGLCLSLTLPNEVQDHFLGDDGHIRQIVINLIGNAIEFTPTGNVKVDVRIAPVNGSFSVEISVTDSGIGIAPVALGRIFDAFSQAEEDTTRNYGGTGLGLTISRKFANEMGGDIHVTSVVGEGSCFTLTLFLQGTKPVEATKRENPPKPKHQSELKDRRILIADDNGTNRLLIQKMLEQHANNLRFAKDGMDVVEKYKTHNPELVLMDVSMPKQNGLQATRCIRELEEISGNRAVIIALTANAFDRDKEECLKAGMDGFLSKPVKMNELLESVGFHLSQQ